MENFQKFIASQKVIDSSWTLAEFHDFDHPNMRIKFEPGWCAQQVDEPAPHRKIGGTPLLLRGTVLFILQFGIDTLLSMYNKH